MHDPIRLRPMLLLVSVIMLCQSGACTNAEGARSLAGDSAVAGALPKGHPSVATSVELPEIARQMLDSGNAAFRAKSFDVARRHYEKAAQLAPLHAAPWFGIFMIGDATKNSALADSAMAEVRKRTGGTDMPSHSDSARRSPHASLPGT